MRLTKMTTEEKEYILSNIDVEKALDIILKCVEKSNVPCADEAFEDISSVIRHLIDISYRADDPWFDYTISHPTKAGNYIVQFWTGDVWMARYDEDKDGKLKWMYHDQDDIKYWIPVPKAHHEQEGKK